MDVNEVAACCCCWVQFVWRRRSRRENRWRVRLPGRVEWGGTMWRRPRSERRRQSLSGVSTLLWTVLQMTSNVTQRYAVSPLLPGANVTIELVRSRSLVAHADYVSRRRQDFRVRLFVRLFVCLFVRSITQKRMIPKCSNSVYGMTLGYTRSDVLLGLKG